MLSMSLTRADFDNPAVASAANPSASGWHHGKHMQNRSSTYAENMQALFRITIPATSTRLAPLPLQLVLAVSISWAPAGHMLTSTTALPNVTPTQNAGMFLIFVHAFSIC